MRELDTLEPERGTGSMQDREGSRDTVGQRGRLGHCKTEKEPKTM